MAVVATPGGQVQRIADLESERDTAWGEGSRVFCKDTGKLYILIAGAFIQLNGGGGSDPWTYAKLASDFSTTSNTAQNVTGLALTPAANTTYEFEACLFLRTATATVNPRVGIAWPTGMTDGVAQIWESQSATAQLLAFGNINAALLVAVGGLANNTQSWPAGVSGVLVSGASPLSTFRVQLASETSGTSVTIKAGSFLKYRTI